MMLFENDQCEVKLHFFKVVWGYNSAFWLTELEKAQFAAFFLINFLAENLRPYQMVYRPGDMIGKNVQSRDQSMKVK